ncbi:MAG: 16S rRNA (cytosine(967)-C(5))-methyltransferase RsmB [Eubacteriales bacterium]|nr:16S rRNA (cytosine(967)-C(5))-methyltransferase RsmB [Eubacteriales bacterium]
MANAVNDRELIMEILLAVTKDGEYSHIALRNVLENYQYLDKSERAFITRVTEGTLEHMIEIDYIINQFSKVKVNKMKPVIRTIIRSAVYQLKYMDSVPDSAVCNEAVKLAAKRGFGGLKGFVNGVLRSISRNIEQVKYPDKADRLRWLSVTYSMPEWILSQWLKEYDQQTVEGMLKDFLREKPTAIRCNLSRISRDELAAELEREGIRVCLHPTLPCALSISGYDYLGAVESFQKGYFQVQDVSSMEVAEWAAPKKGDYIIDVCAAPGGKALHMADKLEGTGHVEARDLTEYKIELIRDNIRRSGMDNISAVCQDATVFAEESAGRADIVIADLPCSGLGVLGRKTDLKYKMTPQTQESLVKLQREILSVVNQYVKPGGKLLYSTCTIHKSENEENARWFAKTFPEFKLAREKQFLPGVDESDGFYIAEFRRIKPVAEEGV